MSVPQYHNLFNPVLDAIRQLGGSSSVDELDDRVITDLRLSDTDASTPHKDGRRTEIQYRLAWARTYLKAYGLLDNTQRGIWHLTPKGRETARVDPGAVNRFVRERSRSRTASPTKAEAATEIDEAEVQEGWREALLGTLLRLTPDKYERLAQRILRESGFTQVTVSGRTGDGGIDGTGIVQLGGLLSFPVLFQCKRYKDSVGAGVVRDFRGAMVGRTDRGLIITTGSFTPAARDEATRDGAPLIDLVDGDQLLDKLKDLRLGVDIRTRTVEDITIVRDFFEDI